MTRVEGFGAVGNGETDDREAIQHALDTLLQNGGVLEFDGFRTYRVDGPLTLLRSSASHATRMIIRGNGAKFDMRALTGSVTGLTAGGSTKGDFVEIGELDISNLELLGPETGNPRTTTPLQAPRTNTIGFSFQYCGHLRTRGLRSNYFQTGMRTRFTFPLVADAIDVTQNWIGLHIDEASNWAHWRSVDAAECRYGILIRGSARDANAEISSVTLSQLRVEGCLVGVEVDPGPGSRSTDVLNGICIQDIFAANVKYDVIRAGKTHDLATPGVRGTQRAAQIYDFRLIGGVLPTGGWSSSSVHSALVLGTNVRNVRLHLMLADSADAIVGTPLGAEYGLLGANGGAGTEVTRLIFDSGGGRVAKFGEKEGWFAGEGWATFAGVTGLVTRSRGNIASVTRNAPGTYTIQFAADYDGANTYHVSSASEAAIVGVSSRGAGSVVVSTKDHSGTDVDPPVVSVYVRGTLA
jgi:hypothetical protein